MKTKLLFFIYFLSTSLLFATTDKSNPNEPVVKIILKDGDNETPDEDKRSLVIEPSASHDNSSVYISTPVFTDGMKVEIYDENDNLVYTNVYGHTNNVVIDIAASGNYVLEITIGEDFFYGYFTIE